MTELIISITGANADTITFDLDNYVLSDGVRGFGIPVTEVRIDPVSGNGGIWRSSRRGVREIDLPVTVLGTSRADVQAKMRRLSRILQDTNGAGPRLTVTYPDASAIFLDVHYTTGAETQYGEDARGTYVKWVVTVQAPQPFWQTTLEESFNIGSGSTGRGLLPQLTKLKVSSSQSLGVVTVNNVGDVTIQPRWIITGPVTDLVISDGTSQFTFTDPIEAGVTYIVDTSTGTVVDAEGVNSYALLGPAPKFFGLPPGTTGISVFGTDADIQTMITCYYSPRYEVAH